jgi:methylmalonyl-CoA/ethylmalonyl-CoA epimerase
MDAPHPPHSLVSADLTLDHVAIATPDLDQGSLPYLALGLVPEGPDENVGSQGVQVRAFWAGPTLIELLAPTREDSPVAAFLARRGPGLHHTAYRVADLDAEMARLRSLGARFLQDAPTPGRAGTRVAFLHPKWGAGTLIELVEHPAHPAAE